jgi:hypothetical protein
MEISEMSVRAKFFLHAITKSAMGGEVTKLVFSASTDENESWKQWTPAGTLEMTVNPAAAKHFILGKHYYLDLTEVAEA